jgi:hypothetical protein
MKCTGLYQLVSQSDEVNSQCYKYAVSSDEIMAFGPSAFCLSLIVRIFDIILLRDHLQFGSALRIYVCV